MSSQQSISHTAIPYAPLLQPLMNNMIISPCQLYHTINNNPIQYPINNDSMAAANCIYCHTECSDTVQHTIYTCCKQVICHPCLSTYTHQHHCSTPLKPNTITTPLHTSSSVMNGTHTPIATPTKLFTPIQFSNVRWPSSLTLPRPSNSTATAPYNNNQLWYSSINHNNNGGSTNNSIGYRTPTTIPLSISHRSVSDNHPYHTNTSYTTPLSYLMQPCSTSPIAYLKLTPPHSRSISPKKLFTDITNEVNNESAGSVPPRSIFIPMTPNHTDSNHTTNMDDSTNESNAISPNKISLTNTLYMLKHGFFGQSSSVGTTDGSDNTLPGDIKTPKQNKRKRYTALSDDEYIHSTTNTDELYPAADPSSPYTCTLCDKQFDKLSALKRHSRCHSGIRPYKCTYPNCTQSFTENGNLKRHYLIHSGVKPHECERCGKKFARRCHLIQHERAKQRATACANKYEHQQQEHAYVA